MNEKLTKFLKERGYTDASQLFKKFIEDEATITEVKEVPKETAGGPQKEITKFKYEFKEEMHKIILKFLRLPKAQKFIEKFNERNTDAEKYYVQDVRNSLDFNFLNIFDSFILNPQKLPTTSIIKQCEKRYEHLIEKHTFTADQIELLKIGVFFFTIIYYLAKQEKIKAQVGVEKREPAKPSTESKKLDSILDNKLSRVWPMYYYDKDAPYNLRARSYLANYFADRKKFYEMLPTKEDRGRLYNWVTTNKEKIKHLPCLDSNLQEGEHTFLYTTSVDSNLDAFARCIFDSYPDVSEEDLTTYFFKGSHKEELILDGRETGISGYTGEKLLDGLPNRYDLKYLEENLKPIWFRDITKENKKYTKISFSQLREMAASKWKNLLYQKVIKYIQLTYQCQEDSILVSFKTNQFDQKTPTVLDEEAFKALYRKNPDRALYRGLSQGSGWTGPKDTRPVSVMLKKMREKGIAYNIKKHNEQYLGPGIYWSKALNTDGSYGNLIVMGIGTADLPDTPENGPFTTEARSNLETFLQRNNTSVILRKVAMYNNTKNVLTDEEKRAWEKLDVVVCNTKDEMMNWAKCK